MSFNEISTRFPDEKCRFVGRTVGTAVSGGQTQVNGDTGMSFSKAWPGTQTAHLRLLPKVEN